MGNCCKRAKVPLVHIPKPPIICPNCGISFPLITQNSVINNHLDFCLILNINKPKTKELEIIYFEKTSPNVITKKIKKFSNTDLINIEKMTLNEIKNSEFSDKLCWFKKKIDSIRIPWTQGSDPILVHTDRIIIDSINFMNFCDFRKEIKIYFEDQKVEDAGGLLREWIYLVIKHLFSKETGLFIQNENGRYGLNHLKELDQLTVDKLRLVGKTLSKAIFEGIPIIPLLDVGFLQILLGKSVDIENLLYIDPQLYNSLTFLQKNDLDSLDLDEYFEIYESKTQTIKELIPGGSQKKITNENKEEFILLNLQYFTVDRFSSQYQIILKEFYSLIPENYINIFNFFELESLMNGLPKIDIDDWKSNTEYKGIFNSNHHVILWFWDIMQELEPLELSKILQFCTGLPCIGVQGFNGLESNRGNKQKFTIESTSNKGFPEAHTCFNRLVLPVYDSKKQLSDFLKKICCNEFEGLFGLD